MIKTEQAQRADAPHIARMIMEAMNLDCCQWFAGPHHTLADFERLMTRLVERDDSQYSYLNTIVAADYAESGQRTVAGICVSYDGAKLHELRKAFVDSAREAFGIDYSNIDDETSAGEFYADSLCVLPEYRGQGIASKLLLATVEKGRQLGLPTGLLVDNGNPLAEKLYKRLGFQVVGEHTWGGHNLRRMRMA